MTHRAARDRDPLAGLVVLERGWLSSNNVLVGDAAGGDEGCALVDSGHVVHAAQTVALVGHALAGRRLVELVNTHLHSDHCGGNAALADAHPSLRVRVPARSADAVARWDDDALSHRPTGQLCARFHAHGTLDAGERWHAGGRRWEVLGAPGHDPQSLMLFDRAAGVLLSADALWENGFGVVFPELVGEPGFDDVEAVFDTIAALPVRVVVPGHGAPFGDVDAALRRARARLDGFRREPQRHARHAAKVLVKYHLMEVQRQRLDALLDWAVATPLLPALRARTGAGHADLRRWAAGLVDDLVGAGALGLVDGGAVVVDR